MLNDYIIAAIDFIKTLRTEHIALISIFVTFVIFIIGKRKENKLKTYETRKEHYKKLVDFFQSIFATIGSNNDQDVLVASKREEFFEMGSSLAFSVQESSIKHTVFIGNLQSMKTYRKLGTSIMK